MDSDNTVRTGLNSNIPTDCLLENAQMDNPLPIFVEDNTVFIYLLIILITTILIGTCG